MPEGEEESRQKREARILVYILLALLILPAVEQIDTTEPPLKTENASWLYDDFQGTSYNLTSDGQTTPGGKWKAKYLGFGSAFTESVSGNDFFVVSPLLDELRAARIDTQQIFGEGIHGKLDARLDQQSTNDTQPWYTIWPLIANVDDATHYYFNLKTSGWELGKKDNDHPPGEELQEHLATGTSTHATIGDWNTIEWWVQPDPNGTNNMRLKVTVNGTTVVDMLDNQPWQRNGGNGTGASDYMITSPKGFALYQEGSQVSWDNIYLQPISVGGGDKEI